MQRIFDRPLALLAATLGALLLPACSGDDDSGGGNNPSSGGFAIVTSNVLDGTVWQLNRPIDITFNQDVDFSSVSSSTIQIIDNQGAPAVGTFALLTPRIVRFQPRCPTNDDNSNGGLLQGGSYRLTAIAENSPGLGGGVTVMSTSGDRLEVGLNLSFTTPTSNDPLILFVDVVAGPPQVRVRGLNGEPDDSVASSFVEFGDGTIEYFAFDTSAQAGLLPNPSDPTRVDVPVPLNYYSRSDDQFDVVLRFNQPIFASTTNVNSALIGLEYSYDIDPTNEFEGLTWTRVPSTVSVIDNCTETGAAVRLEPTGIVPQDALIRVVLSEGFRDLTGDPVQSTQTRFARVRSVEATPGSPTPFDGSDEVLELFEVGGDQPSSLEDTAVASALPRANWSGAGNQGTLAASFDFDGTGGPNGEFDWYIRSGETVFLDTAGDTISGGPGGAISFQQPVFNGIVDVRDLVVEQGGSLVIVGPNPCTVLATGNVVVEGSVSLDGGDNAGVGTLNTTNQPEEGAAGQAGGGSGGVGSFLTAQSTPKGGDGNGAFDVPGEGGRGGESGFAPSGSCAIENRRAAGGGGGTFGPDIFYLWDQGVTIPEFYACQTLVGMDGEPGFTGSPDGTGAMSQSVAARGGDRAPSPFRDESDENDFFGALLTAPDESTGQRRLILGELPGIWAGSGGGAGGDASLTATFPMTPFSPTGDEKGSGGGGGGGGILILALGRDDSQDVNLLGADAPGILIRGAGSLSADGGDGGGGENTIFFDRIGGGSGAGSGGHIVLSSASSITISSEATQAVGDFYLDEETFPVHELRPLRALGGQGGAGKDSRCGANEDGPTQWRTDAIPIGVFRGNGSVPPQQEAVWQNCNRIDGCSVIEPPEGTAPGGGGDGSPGLIQLHVADPATQLLFPNRIGVYGVDLDPTRSMSPPPLGWRQVGPTSMNPNPTEADTAIPFFSARSEAFSRWIPLGLARLEPPSLPSDPVTGVVDQVEFVFEGTDPATGAVIRSGSNAMELPPLIDWTALSIGGAVPSVNPDTATFTLPGAAIDELYKQNAELTREFAVRVREQNDTSDTEFIVQSGTYDEANDSFDLVVDPRGTELRDLLLSLVNAEVQLVPFFFRLETGSIDDLFPLNTDVFIGFDATVENPLTGEPSANPADAFSGGDTSAFATDITELNMATWDFVRFKVEFNLDTSGAGVDLGAPRPGLDYLRIPYRF